MSLIHFHTAREGGYTLVETLAAMLVLTMALTPAILVASSVLDISQDIQNNLVASLLAQEGIEVLHSLRDYNWLRCNEFATGLGNGTYVVDVNTVWTDCSAGRALTVASSNNDALAINGSGVYGHHVGSPTPFRRTVILSAVSANQIRVVSQVIWRAKDGDTAEGGVLPGCPVGHYCLQVESHLYNWR